MAFPNTSSLFSDLDVDVELDAPVGQMTWYGVGGRADVLLRPHSVDALATLVGRCRRQATPLRILGNGANLLIADEGVDGVVVKLDHPTFRDTRYDGSGDRSTLHAMAGADMARTLMESTRQGLDGLSQMAGIPGSIGGIVRMNAGGKFGSIGDVVTQVTCITRGGETVTYPASELRFEYRTTNIPDPVIVAAAFELTTDDPIRLRDRVKEIFAFKKSSQPLADHSAGCTFRNPIDPVTNTLTPAGRLIESAGLKGTTIGGATVSDQHANFIVVTGGASADDVIRLLDLVKSTVLDVTGFELEEEIRIWRRGSENA